MEHQIEIIGKDTLKMYRCMQYRLYGFLPICFSVVFLLYLRVTLEDLLRTGEAYYRIMAIVYALFMLLFLLYPELISRIKYKSKLKYYDGVMPVGTLRFEEQISFQDIDSTLTIPYSKIEKIYLLRNAIVIMTEGKNGHCFPHGTFEKGSLPELKQLLRSKRPDLKIIE